MPLWSDNSNYHVGTRRKKLFCVTLEIKIKFWNSKIYEEIKIYDRLEIIFTNSWRHSFRDLRQRSWLRSRSSQAVACCPVWQLITKNKIFNFRLLRSIYDCCSIVEDEIKNEILNLWRDEIWNSNLEIYEVMSLFISSCIHFVLFQITRFEFVYTSCLQDVY